MVAVGPGEVLSRRGHHVLRLGLQLDRPVAHRWRCLRVAAGDRWPVALHHLVGDAAPQHRPALVHETGEEGVCLVVGDSFLVVDAAVQGDVDTEGQESHGVLRSRYATSRSPSGSKGARPIREVLTLCRLTGCRLAALRRHNEEDWPQGRPPKSRAKVEAAPAASVARVVGRRGTRDAAGCAVQAARTGARARQAPHWIIYLGIKT